MINYYYLIILFNIKAKHTFIIIYLLVAIKYLDKKNYNFETIYRDKETC